MEAGMTREGPHVRGVLTFLGDVSGTPTNYLDGVEPPPGAPPLYPRVRREVPIFDGRRTDGPTSMDREGFVLAQDPEGIVPDFHDAALLKSVGYPAVERLVRAVTGASRVVIFDHTHRSSALAARAADSTDIAVQEVHNDLTATSGPRRVRELLAGLLPGEDTDELMRHRYGVFNVWRSTAGVVERMPLALCDMRTLDPRDVVDAELKWPRRTGYVCAIRHNPAQRWFTFPAMDPREALVFKCYDSVAREGGARFGAHTSFDDPTSSADARPRESIEVRAIALFP
jgi:hypothetical protein